MPSVQHPRGTRSAFEALAGANLLLPGQVYLLTDEQRLAVALTASTYEAFVKETDFDALESEIITARGSRSQLNLRLRAISNFASPNAGGIVSGRVYDNAFHGTASSTLAAVANGCLLVPFYTSDPLSISQIGVAISTVGAAGALARYGIYDSTTDGWANQLLWESPASVDFASTGHKVSTVDPAFSLESGRQYWLALHSSSTGTMRAVNISSCVNLGLTAGTATTYANSLRRLIPYANGLPANWNFVPADIFSSSGLPSFRMIAA